ncbi:Acyltransferase family protein [Streptosporangium subroseum]|uniref:Acyltransferase family protein n=1 Tax=Streptosporangium subroseum TaxID=106412 RepID=A0A239N4W1_9ACTN|nr:acyltransferase [Streptosporangium subroseum]SNT49494.1 Acyltransferase family protein [Streptosporangium subroseum]
MADLAHRTAAPARSAPEARGGWVLRIGSATPLARDRGVDALRALAILGVVLGHWLVTAWALAPTGAVRISSPLGHLPMFTPLSWVFQTLAVFFFVGGYAAARSRLSASTSTSTSATATATATARSQPPAATRPAGAWVRARTARLLGPVVPLLLVWAGIAAGMALHRMPFGTIRALTLPAVGPLWFLAVFVALTAATPLLLRPRPLVTAVVAGAVVLGVDVARFWLDGPAWLKWANLAAGWLVPYALGIAWANGAFASRRTAAGLLAGGTAGAVVLIAGFGYPASMVGVTGAEVSNLSPPTLAAVCFGIAQVGLALLVRDPLTRLMRRPGLWAVVALANASAMTIFLWHQTALTVTAVAALRFGEVPGLLSTPDEPIWLLHRLAWFPVLAALLSIIWLSVFAKGRFNDRVSSSA